MPKWLEIVSKLAPIALSFTPAAPIAQFIVPAIVEAEALHGSGSGAEKLAHARNVVQLGIAATNAQAGHQEIDPTLVDTALVQGVSTAVSVANVVHAAKAEDVAEVLPTATPVSAT